MPIIFQKFSRIFLELFCAEPAIKLRYITCFDIRIIHQRILTTSLHASHCHLCHYCNVDFMSFHIVTSYTNSYYHVCTLTLQVSSYHMPSFLCEIYIVIRPNYQCYVNIFLHITLPTPNNNLQPIVL